MGIIGTVGFIGTDRRQSENRSQKDALMIFMIDDSARDFDRMTEKKEIPNTSSPRE